MPYEQILYEQKGATARITLNRPEKLNAITPRMQRELHEALWEADAQRRAEQEARLERKQP